MQKKCKDFKQPRKMKHVTVQIWVLQNVDENLAESITKEANKSSSPILENIELKPNDLHSQHQSNQLRNFHGVKQRKETLVKTHLSGSMRAIVRSVTSLDNDKADPIQKIVACLMSRRVVDPTSSTFEEDVSKRVCSTASHAVTKFDFDDRSPCPKDDVFKIGTTVDRNNFVCDPVTSSLKDAQQGNSKRKN